MQGPILRRVAWPAICAGAAGIAWLIGTGNVADPAWPLAIFGTVVGLAWCLTGLAAWGWRPDHRTGALMLLVGLAWFASMLQFTPVSLLYTLGMLAGPAYMAVFMHLLLAFPSGRLGDRTARIVVVAAYVDTSSPTSALRISRTRRARGSALARRPPRWHPRSMPPSPRLRERLVTLASYLLDPFGTANARSAAAEDASEPRAEAVEQRSGEATGDR